jgi:hypothetical protein
VEAKIRNTSERTPFRKALVFLEQCPARSKYFLMSGYAMSKKGVWKPHSWVLHERKDGTCDVYDTTNKHAAYYGVKFTQNEIKRFLEC